MSRHHIGFIWYNDYKDHVRLPSLDDMKKDPNFMKTILSISYLEKIADADWWCHHADNFWPKASVENTDLVAEEPMTEFITLADIQPNLFIQTTLDSYIADTNIVVEESAPNSNAI
jgi:hypothetical protein